MVEIRIHGRGGQGSVSAAYLLALAAFESGLYGQAFPSFGAERRGAPISAFVRIHQTPFSRYCLVLSPDYLIILDESLIFLPETLSGLATSGGILVNSRKSRLEIQKQFLERGLSFQEDSRMELVGATEISLAHLGKSIPNTVLVSAFLSLTKIISQSSLEKALAKRFNGPVLDANLKMVREGSNQVKEGSWKDSHPESRYQAHA
jgi:pyruvate ferredoxin oxidoreductase gamma subunit